MKKYRQDFEQYINLLCGSKCIEIKYGLDGILIIEFGRDGYEEISLLIETHWRLLIHEKVVLTYDSEYEVGEKLFPQLIDLTVKEIKLCPFTFDLAIELESGFGIEVFCLQNNEEDKEYVNYTLFINSTQNEISERGYTVEWDFTISKTEYE